MNTIAISPGKTAPPRRARLSIAATVWMLGTLAATSSAQVSVDWNSTDPVLQFQQALAADDLAAKIKMAAIVKDLRETRLAGERAGLSPEDAQWVKDMSSWTEGMSVAMMFDIVEEQVAYLEKLSRKLEESRQLSREGRLSGMPDWSLYEDFMPALVQLKGALAQARTELGTDPVSSRRHLAAAQSQAARLYTLSRPLSKVADAPRWSGPEIKRMAVILHIFLPAIERKMPAEA
mgnify:FL=1